MVWHSDAPRFSRRNVRHGLPDANIIYVITANPAPVANQHRHTFAAPMPIIMGIVVTTNIIVRIVIIVSIVIIITIASNDTNIAYIITTNPVPAANQ